MSDTNAGGKSAPQRRNPYEDADPIPVKASSTHRSRMQTTPHVRSRQVQSARDAAHRRQASTSQATGSSSRTPNPQDRRRPPRQAKPYAMRTRRKTNFGIIAGAIIAAIVVLSGILWWINRPVPITVNGEAAEIRVGSTLEEVLDAQDVSVEPGDYVSVGEHVLEAGKGRAFTATVNGEKLSYEDTDSYHVRGKESIEFSDGEDLVEDYEAESEVIMPYLRMDGSGYAVQYVSQWGYAGELQHRKGKVSGEEANVVAKEAQDCVITCTDLYLDGDTNYVALTFDDGPADPYTEEYLEILDRYGVKATFYNLGDNTLSYPEIAKKVVEAGHQLANHTMAHNQLTSVDASTVYSEITRSAKAIEDTTGVYTSHIRPPYGDFTERSWLGSGGAITAAIRWTGDSEDWKLPGAEKMVSNSLLNLRSGSIILMHDGGGDRSQDVEALPMLIERLQSEGYEFVTISDLMRAAGIPEDICSGSGVMPDDAVWPEEIHPDDLAAAAAASSASTTTTTTSTTS